MQMAGNKLSGGCHVTQVRVLVRTERRGNAHYENVTHAYVRLGATGLEARAFAAADSVPFSLQVREVARGRGKCSDFDGVDIIRDNIKPCIVKDTGKGQTDVADAYNCY
jgi:hypothetical protein